MFSEMADSDVEGPLPVIAVGARSGRRNMITVPDNTPPGKEECSDGVVRDVWN